MLNVRWLHHSKAALLALLVLAAVGPLGALLWMNQHGFEGEWGRRIADELARHGVHARFSMARFSPTRGIIARDVVIYTGPDLTRVLAEIPRLRFEVDGAKALRGELRIRRVFVQDARLSLPLDGAGSQSLHFTALSGRASLDRGNRFLLEQAKGTLAGISFRLDVELDEFGVNSLPTSSEATTPSRSDAFFSSALRELAQWSFPASLPAELDLRVTGSMRQPDRIRTAFSLTARELRRRDYPMQDVLLAGELRGSTLAIEQLRFSDGLGLLEATARYDLEEHHGQYVLRSTVKIGDLLRQALGNHVLDDIVSAHAPHLAAHGQFSTSPDEPSLSVIGSLAWKQFRFLGNPFDNLQSEFCWRDGRLFLRNLAVSHEDGELAGRILIGDDTIRYEVDSTLPLAVYRAFLKEDGGLAKSLARSSFTDQGSAHIVAEGSIRRNDLRDWSARGHATFQNFAYHDVPLARASARFDISPRHSRYEDVQADFSYHDYKLLRRHGGPGQAAVTAREIRYDGDTRLTHLAGLQGTAWPGPVLRLFLPSVSDHVEQQYRFHQPPSFETSGVIDMNTPGLRTDLTTRLRAPGSTEYTFLDRSLPLTRLSATIRTRRHLHDVTDLSFASLGANVGGQLTVRDVPGRPATYSGGLQWTDASLTEIGQAYRFDTPAFGRLTGRVDFDGVVGRIGAFNGHGVIGLRNGQLFHVPVFGPLSGPIGSVLGNKNFSHEQARDASATFVIRDGVVFTNDFLTSTPSTVFTGEGHLDLSTSRLDMTVRMNARGLLGLVTLPLLPFNGLFQFRGQGPMKDPVWSSAAFTPPSAGPADPIFRAPPRAQVVREP